MVWTMSEDLTFFLSFLVQVQVQVGGDFGDSKQWLAELVLKQKMIS